MMHLLTCVCHIHEAIGTMLAWRPPILAVLLCGFLQSLQLNTKIVSELGLDHILLHCFHFINHPIILKYVV